ncbi:MAG TPA: hypothetical protein VHC40_06835 [Rhizomicrobium sp.]|nr:hypothetical protein [Rhizomicrobium sp.]
MGGLQGIPEAGPALLQAARRIGIWLWLLVIVPAALGGLYFFLIASDQYVSEARFIVRSQSREMPSMLGTMLQSAGLQQRSSDDASAVESFITSRDAVRALERDVPLRAIFDRPEGDFITRFPNPVSGASFEALYRHYKRFVDVSIDATNGVTTLEVKAYRPEDAQLVAQALLRASEKLVNDLNARAQADAVRYAQHEVESAQKNLAGIQEQLTQYRYREQILDPKLTTVSLNTTLTGLMTVRAQTAAQLAELTRDSPGNPAIPRLRSRLAALDAQFDDAMKAMAGGSGSIAGKLGEYERLSLSADLAAKLLATATQALETARMDAQSKHLYIEHIAEPNLPDEALYPKRILSFCFLLAACLLVYGIAWLLIAGVREHVAG